MTISEHVMPIRPGVQVLDSPPLNAAAQICVRVAASLRQAEEVVDDWDFWPPIESQLVVALDLFEHDDRLTHAAGGTTRVPRLAIAAVEIVEHCANNPADWSAYARSFAELLDAASDALSQVEARS